MRCPHCGGEIDFFEKDMTYTPNIINDIYINQPPTEEISTRKKSTSIILCCLGFFGLGGFHRFYAGQIGTGLVWLCTFGCFLIGTVIDLITIIMGKFYDSRERRISKW